jgi:hypothetical protein
MNETFTPKRVALALGLLLVLAFLGPATGSATFFYRDFGVLGYPTASYHREMFWRGELPLWNPYSNCGVPFLAQWGTMTLYPFTLIYLILPFPWSLNLFCLAHLWLGAFGIFRLAQKWTGSNPAGAVAAVVFLFNGITQSTLYWPNYTVALAWTPWLILFTQNTWRRPLASIALPAACGALQMLSGAPELILISWLLIGAIALADALREPEHRRRIALRLPIIAAVVAALCAIQLLPFFDLLQLSHRQPVAAAGPVKWGLPTTALGSFLLPMLHAFRTPQNTYFQHGQHFLSSIYIGLPAVLLVVLAWMAPKRTAPYRWPLTLVTVAAIFCAMSGDLLQNLPFLGLARYPVKFTLLLPLTIPLLAAFGLKAFLEKEVCCRTFLQIVGGMFAASLAIFFWAKYHPLQFDYWPTASANSIAHLVAFAVAAGLLRQAARSQGILLVLFLLLIAVEGRFHIPNQNPTTSIATLKGAIGSRPLPKLGEGRAFITREAEKVFLNSEVPNLETDFTGKQIAIWSHLNLIELAPKVNGSATLQIREQKEFQDWLYSGTNVNQEAWLDFLGVTQITSPTNPTEWTNRATALPIVRVAPEIHPVPALRSGLRSEWFWGSPKFQLITNATFDPRREVSVDSVPDSSPVGSGRIADLKFSACEIAFKLTGTSNAAILVAQSWHPNWEMEIKGQSKAVPARHGNHAFQVYEYITMTTLSPSERRVPSPCWGREFCWFGLVNAVPREQFQRPSGAQGLKCEGPVVALALLAYTPATFLHPSGRKKRVEVFELSDCLECLG